jgi:hypothetical protein
VSLAPAAATSAELSQPPPPPHAVNFRPSTAWPIRRLNSMTDWRRRDR